MIPSLPVPWHAPMPPLGLLAWVIALAGTSVLSALGATPLTAATIVIALGGLCAELAQRFGPGPAALSGRR
ncbi:MULTISPECIES: hypothetical protein [unclassified Crossiella]|uniref:hypothetical protein n=1 Tax=unclassified Crossiella TaxID=2620835 RepID=UPI001FFE6E83|nr:MULTISPECIES: hypothetical protein [unclassified Crossiella]MCK2240789.1 hypothetical protein [Crossiella sp. S99.2]MCK2254067.1 hypothetical protein [Crossiella sp. S99.1]